MELLPWRHRQPPAMSLAGIDAFTLGPLTVEPAARRVSGGDRHEMLEPRVMRVLVALSQAGKVLSRDELLERCWDGQIVSDNAINRAISLLRRTLDALSEGAVRLETITKVGFRLVVAEAGAGEPPLPAAAEPPAPPSADRWPWSRRFVAGGLVAAGLAAAGAVYGVAQLRRHEPDPRARDLYDRGQLAQKTGMVGAVRQAMAFYTQAVAIDPDFADAWGALAVGYRHGGDGFVDEPRDAYPRLVRSAAGRALALDRNQPDAHMAILTIYSDLGRWSEREAGLRAIVRRSPGYWFGHAQLDLLLQNVGRFEEGIVSRRRQIEIDSMIPPGWAHYARGLHYAGRDHEADIALDQAFGRWPAHPLLWMARYQVLTGSRRFMEAAAFARDPRPRPEGFPPQLAAFFAALADALATRTTIGAILERGRRAPVNLELVPVMAPLFAELGDADRAFELLGAYLLGGSVGGQRFPEPGPLDSRVTSVLFAPALLSLSRADRRHAALLERVGLEDYWRTTNTSPDFRRGQATGAA